MSTKRIFLNIAGIRLCCVDFGGEGQPVLLLHGLAGRGNEWRNTASWLTQHGHIFALDQRGHGMSDINLSDYSRDTYVNDVIAVIEKLGLQNTLLIGQSMGAQNAFLAAAHRPDLVARLIVVEAIASPNPSAQKMVSKWLDAWPLPFPSLADARAFFGGDTLYAETWLEVLEEHPEGYWPQFKKDDMLRSIEDQVICDYWNEWRRITCPTLVVGGANSFLPQNELKAMAQILPHGRYIQIEHAGHDLHLEQPAAWRQAVEDFLTGPEKPQ